MFNSIDCGRSKHGQSHTVLGLTKHLQHATKGKYHLIATKELIHIKLRYPNSMGKQVTEYSRKFLLAANSGKRSRTLTSCFNTSVPWNPSLRQTNMLLCNSGTLAWIM